MLYSCRQLHDPRLELTYTLTPGEGANSVANLKEKELTKEEELRLYDDEHIYDEPSKYFEAHLTEPPPSYNTSITTFNRASLAANAEVTPSPMANESRITCIPNDYMNLPSHSPAVPTHEVTCLLDPPQAPEYSEPISRPRLQAPPPANTDQPIPPFLQPTKDMATISSPAVAQQNEVAMTTSNVPLPALGGERGVRGKPPGLEPMKQENQEYDEYVRMASSTL